MLKTFLLESCLSQKTSLSSSALPFLTCTKLDKSWIEGVQKILGIFIFVCLLLFLSLVRLRTELYSSLLRAGVGFWLPSLDAIMLQAPHGLRPLRLQKTQVCASQQ